jgi:hypothetical protein
MSAFGGIEQRLSLAPVPYLSTAFSYFNLICGSVEKAQASKLELQNLAVSLAQLLQALNKAFRDGQHTPVSASTDINNLFG